MNLAVTKKAIATNNDKDGSGMDAASLRLRALDLPDLRHRVSAIEFALSDPDVSVRLRAARNLAELCERTYERKGIGAVTGLLEEILQRSRLFFMHHDPRIPQEGSFKPDRARLNVRLGVLMAIQSVMRRTDSPLRVPLAREVNERGFFDTLQAARVDRDYVRECIKSGFRVPECAPSSDDTLACLLDVVRFAVAVSALEYEAARNIHFSDLQVEQRLLNPTSTMRYSLLDAIGNIGAAIIEGERDPMVASAMGKELHQVVGRVIPIGRLGRSASKALAETTD